MVERPLPVAIRAQLHRSSRKDWCFVSAVQWLPVPSLDILD